MTDTKVLIAKLREVKEERGLSLNDIVEMTGKAVSKSTLQKLFAEDADATTFRYETTIKPVANVLLDIDTLEEDDTDNVQAMKLLLKYKSKRIDELEREIARLSASLDHEKVKRHEAIDEERRRFEGQEVLYREQLAYKDKRMDSFIEAMFKKDEQIREMMEKILRCSKCTHNEE